MEIITRDLYSTKIDQWIGKGMIIVVTGQRRIGKSSILKDFVKRHSREADANIIYIDKEKRDYRFIKDQETLGDYLEAQLKKRKHNYILIDEIQDIDGWEHAIRSFRTEDNTDIIITGSNSRMLSSELSTLLSGRYVEIPVQGLSYMEFLLFHKLTDSDDALRQYLFYGGLPGLCQIGLTDEDLIWNYQKSVFDTVMLKDVVERHNIRNIPFLRTLIEYLADTTGKPQSASNISRHMKTQGLDVSVNMILDYMAYFREAYLTNNVQRYDIHGKRILENLQKVYFGDVGLRNHIVGGERERDIEKVIETVVYQHLVRLGYSVTVGELRVGEIDFVCQKSNQIRYVQSAYLIDNEDTRMREFGRLSQIRNHYPKYVVSLTPMVKASDYEGVTHLGLREFLKKGI